MSGQDKNRLRNRTIGFRISPDEERMLNAKIQVSGLSKQEFILRSLLESKVLVTAGKYQSDRLAIELKRIRFELVGLVDVQQFEEQITYCCNLLEQLTEVCS